MLIPVQTFFNSLPEKSCNRCGQSIEEQADCYQNICNSCGDAYFYSLNNQVGGQAFGTQVIRTKN